MVQGFCSGAGQPGTLTELIALGAADKYLTMNPSITFWRFRYLKATNYAMEAVSQTFNTQVSFGGDLQINLNRNGDLIYFMYAEITLPGIVAVGRTADGEMCGNGDSDYATICNACDPCCDGQPDVSAVACGDGGATVCGTATPDDPACDGLPETWAHWVNAVGQYVIQDACLVVGGQPIDYLYGDYLYMWEELSGKPGKRLQEMVGKRYTRAQLIEDSARTRTLYVPLPFWFTRTSGNALALVSLQFHNVRVHMSLASQAKMVQRSGLASAEDCCASAAGGCCTSPTNLQGDPVVVVQDIKGNPVQCRPLQANDIGARLLTTYIYLDIEERDRFAVGAFEQLITQTQSLSQQITTQQPEFQINFNHPIIELIWAFRRQCQESKNNWSNYSGIWGRDPFESASLCVNNQVRFAHDARYFRLVQPYQHHSHIPEGYVYSYSFALYPEEPQPSGSINFSRIDNVTIGFTMQNATDALNTNQVAITTNGYVRFILYGRNWNVFRYRDGLGGVNSFTVIFGIVMVFVVHQF